MKSQDSAERKKKRRRKKLSNYLVPPETSTWLRKYKICLNLLFARESVCQRMWRWVWVSGLILSAGSCTCGPNAPLFTRQGCKCVSTYFKTTELLLAWGSRVFPSGLWGKGRREGVGLEEENGEQQQEAQSRSYNRVQAQGDLNRKKLSK